MNISFLGDMSLGGWFGVCLVVSTVSTISFEIAKQNQLKTDLPVMNLNNIQSPPPFIERIITSHLSVNQTPQVKLEVDVKKEKMSNDSLEMKVTKENTTKEEDITIANNISHVKATSYNTTKSFTTQLSQQFSYEKGTKIQPARFRNHKIVDGIRQRQSSSMALNKKNAKKSAIVKSKTLDKKSSTKYLVVKSKALDKKNAKKPVVKSIKSKPLDKKIAKKPVVKSKGLDKKSSYSVVKSKALDKKSSFPIVNSNDVIDNASNRKSSTSRIITSNFLVNQDVTSTSSQKVLKSEPSVSQKMVANILAGMEPIRAIKAAMNVAPHEAIDIAIAGVFAAPDIAPEIMHTVLEHIKIASLEDIQKMMLAIMVVVPELSREILKVLSQINYKVVDDTTFLMTVTFENGFYSGDKLALSLETGTRSLSFQPLTGGQINPVSPN